MYFLACVLTIQFEAAQKPLRFPERLQLRRDINAALFPAEQQCSHLLTVACLHSDPHQLVLRLTLAEEQPGSLLAHLLRHVSSGQRVHLCQRSGVIGVCELSDPAWTGMSTWADLQASQSPSSWRVTFVTPLLTTSPLSQEHLDALPFPEPESVFSLVHTRWQELSGPPLACSVQQMVQETRCVLATYHLRTVEIPSLQRIGYLGWVEYRCLKSRARTIADLWALARLAFFTGYGYETASGFGTARISYRKRGEECSGAW